MRIVSEKRIREFVEREPRSGEALWHWVDVIESAAWNNPGELKATFGSASFVGDLTVFNIGGNKYRLVSAIKYRWQVVYIRHILTHAEYDEGKWKL